MLNRIEISNLWITCDTFTCTHCIVLYLYFIIISIFVTHKSTACINNRNRNLWKQTYISIQAISESFLRNWTILMIICRWIMIMAYNDNFMILVRWLKCFIKSIFFSIFWIYAFIYEKFSLLFCQPIAAFSRNKAEQWPLKHLDTCIHESFVYDSSQESLSVVLINELFPAFSLKSMVFQRSSDLPFLFHRCLEMLGSI